MEVYADLVMVLNFLVDFLLLLGTNQLGGFPMTPGRCALAAVLGGLYSGACLLPGFRFLGNLLWRCVSLAGMAVIAFGMNGGAWKRGGIFVLLSMSLGGLAMSIGRNNFFALVLAAGLCLGLCRLSFGRRIGGQEYVPVKLRHGEKTMTLMALRDTGNTLRDPITGEPVLVVSAEVGKTLTGLTEKQLASPLETLAHRPVPGLRLIPYHAVGQPGGMLLGLRMDQVTIGDRQHRCVVAFAPEILGKGKEYQALTGGAV